MILSTLALFWCTALSARTCQATISSSDVASEKTAPSAASLEHPVSFNSTKPDAPTPKVIAANTEEESSSSTIESFSAPAPVKSVVKPATPESYETSRQRKIWYGLMGASHGAAAFDAWTTRRAINGAYGTEGDPLQRPFANSNAIYATTQVAPALMDFLGHRMMRSENPTLRKFWWIPQAASTGVSLGAGIHNYRIVH